MFVQLIQREELRSFPDAGTNWSFDECYAFSSGCRASAADPRNADELLIAGKNIVTTSGRRIWIKAAKRSGSASSTGTKLYWKSVGGGAPARRRASALVRERARAISSSDGERSSMRRIDA